MRATMKRILFLMAILPFVGCAQDMTRPVDMPKLVSCTVTILSEGKPLPDAQVTFHSDDPTFKWAPGNVTDSAGKAQMVTYGRFFGVVEGEYAVTVSKLERETFDPANPPRQVKVYTLTDAEYTDPKTTPLNITVRGKTNETFDVGALGNTLLRMEDAN